MIAKQINHRNHWTSTFSRLNKYLTTELDLYTERQFGRYAES
jgi:hypothetical protein